MASRSDKVAEEIKRCVSDILRDGLKDPRLDALYSVTRVKVSKDLSNAVIMVSVYEDEKRAPLIEALRNAKSFVRMQLAGKMKLRHVPELKFVQDDSIEYAADISKLIERTIKKDENAAD